MLINYSDQPIISAKKSVFLAGPTPRDKKIPSWRPTACKYLQELGFEGVVYVPELSTGEAQFNYDNQVEWEWKALERASIIAFWVPRDLNNMPAFTTNIEFGIYSRHNNVVYGRPDTAKGNKYFDKLFARHHDGIIYNDLQDLCNHIVELLSSEINYMPLKFFGRGSGFSDEHTSAYFTTDKDIIIIDCPSSTFQKFKHIESSDYEKFYILITHTHGDHIGGLGLFIQYSFFVLHKYVTIVAPSSSVSEDIATLLRIEGCDSSWYKLINASELEEKWFIDCIPTEHAHELEGKCFGYHLFIDDIDVIYTGDTSTLSPFIPFLTEGSILYVDTSVHYGKVHLKLSDTLDTYINLAKNGIKIYLMHLDNVDDAERIVKEFPNISVVKTI